MAKGKRGTGRPKKLSRAARRDVATGVLDNTLSEAREIAESIRAEENPTTEFFAGIKTRMDALSHDEPQCTLSDLRDEMQEWRDNIPENLQGGDKYASVDEAATGLETVVDELESLKVPKFPEEITDDTTELTVALDEYADALETQKDEADNVEFPGMMG